MWQRIGEQRAILPSMYCSVFRKIPWYFYKFEDSKMKLREYGLRRRNEVHSENEVPELFKRKIEGPSSLLFLKTEQ